MKNLISAIFLTVASVAGVNAQALQDINYKYIYDPGEVFSFQLKKTRTSEGWHILFKFSLNDSTVGLDQYTIYWESRNALSDKEGTPLTVNVPGLLALEGDRQSRYGEFFLTNPAPPVIVAKVVSNAAKRAWMFYETLPATYAANAYLQKGNTPVLDSYVSVNATVTVEGLPSDKILSVAFFTHEFPPAAPVFSEAMSRVSKSMNLDTTFTVSAGQSFVPSRVGLYLVQEDTAAAVGLSFRAEDDYPKLSKIQTLTEPLIYICTKQEFDKLKASNGDKKLFDKTILSITGNADRARNFMRSYFRRVELANQYFGSYKEGWKTDRGMVFIIFGLPDEVYRFNDREVWSYKNNLFKEQFSFARSSSLFDPDNYVLVRDKKYRELWYQMVDLWRKSRF